MVVERKPEMVGNRVELVVGKAQEILRIGDGVVLRVVEEIPLLFALVANELAVELHVVPHELAPLRELEEVRHDGAHLGRADEHAVLDAR